jgi:hypothetical protein
MYLSFLEHALSIDGVEEHSELMMSPLTRFFSLLHGRSLLRSRSSAGEMHLSLPHLHVLLSALLTQSRAKKRSKQDS